MINVSDEFKRLAKGAVRPLSANIGISWDKATTSGSADDLPWQLYNYTNYGTDRVIEANVSRSINFPYGVQSAIADVTLDNHDKVLSLTNDDVLPNRPIKVEFGFTGAENVIQFIGQTESIPEYDGRDNIIAKLSALDFLTVIGELDLTKVVSLRDVRTDEALAIIFDMFGLNSSQYRLDRGVNVIPYLYFDKGKNAGNAISELVQAENGKLWIDEEGRIRFSPRTSDLGKVSVYEFNDGNITEKKPSQTQEIVNHIKITSDIREVQNFQPIYQVANEDGWEKDSDEDDYRVQGLGSLIVWASLEDPAWSVTTPILNGEEVSSNMTAIRVSDGTKVSANVECEITHFTDSVKLGFKNLNGFAISIDYLSLWGEPVKVVNTIEYEAYDDESVEKYGDQLLEINGNNCFGSYKNADNFARSILSQRASFNPTTDITVKGNPALQLDDLITMENKTYKIMSISHKLSKSDGLKTIMTISPFTPITSFILDMSVLNGEDLLG
ncbi:hypothetical protein [Sharpea azabuensis]